MKLITIQFPDSVDITVIPKGTEVTVSDGTQQIADGKIMALTDMTDPEGINFNEPVIIAPVP